MSSKSAKLIFRLSLKETTKYEGKKEKKSLSVIQFYRLLLFAYCPFSKYCPRAWNMYRQFVRCFGKLKKFKNHSASYFWAEESFLSIVSHSFRILFCPLSICFLLLSVCVCSSKSEFLQSLVKCEKSEICIQVKKFMKHFPFFANWTVQQMLEPILFMLQSLNRPNVKIVISYFDFKT